MSDDHGVSRRHVLSMAIAAGGFAVSGAFSVAFAQTLKRTPGEILGPFYPVLRSMEKTADLTILPGKSGRAAGQVIYTMGRVVNVEGQPVKAARVELWQANTHGRYTHPSDTNPAPLDPNFEGFAVQDTDAEGRYRFKTIKPGAYPATANWMRPAHIHFQVSGRQDKIVTQMYFEDDPYNKIDPFLNSVGGAERQELLVKKLLPPPPDFEPDSKMVIFDMALYKG